MLICLLGPCWGAAAQEAENESVTLTLAAAAGTTQRAIDFESTTGPYRLDTGWVPALGIKLKLATVVDPLLLALSVHYETSLNAVGAQYSPDPDSAPGSTPIRSHRFEGGATAAVRFGKRDSGAFLGLFAGYGLRALGSVAELLVPRFTLHGPLLRLELKVPLVAGLLWLRLAPEAQLLPFMTEALTEIAATDGHGYAIGGQASLGLELWERYALRLEYREVHAVAHSSQRDAFTDVERYLMLEGRLLF